ncbi:Gfo/Idh/MocA family oxidoreductase [uncultured Clostridium sp.]|uniref:Gfo/Idh/MocA family protein n=1 Tax=uncultured Clostridium sp. TaxID=59620 RepID=UPI00260F6E2A|nr:Gfo/Idh/MocA family oxidoreductase [uncultured Clostridium sp.]
MRIGIIGIGDICKKAYLPVLTMRDDIELILCTRNQTTINDIKNKYRIKEGYTSITDLINSKIDGVIINSATTSHFEIAKKLLENKIPVYLDKPISLNYKDSEELYKISKENDTRIMVGFNRRFVPKVKDLRNEEYPDIIIMEKNRLNLPNNDTRVFIYDDFIHVVDTVRFLMGQPHEDMSIKYKKDERGLLNIILTLSNKSTTAIAIMNRDNGCNEETIEYMSSGKKTIVTSLVKTTRLTKEGATVSEFGDWIPTLYKRGFESILDEFISGIKENRAFNVSFEDSLISHKICEEIIQYIQ